MEVLRHGSLAVCAALALPAYAADNLMDALVQGKTSLDTRARVEYVDDDSKTEDAHALTNRLVLGYKSAEFYGLVAAIEFENVSSLDDDRYNSGAGGEGNNNARYPLIADPELTQLNQAYLDYKGLRFGRQKWVLDNARFIGDVGWRQNDQTFDALVYSKKDLIPMVQLNVGYLTRVHNILGASRDVAAPIVNVKLSPNKTTNLAAFYYAVDEKSAPAASWSHAGFRADGSVSGLLYDLSWASQSDYADGAGPDADYADIQLGYAFAPLTLKLQYEVLAKGFKTPLATVHAFNGWVDRFTATPAAGLRDMNIKLQASLWTVNWTAAAHRFQAEEGGQDFGTEFNLSAAKKFSDKLSGLLKYGRYEAESGAPGVLGADASKLWLQVQYKFL